MPAPEAGPVLQRYVQIASATRPLWAAPGSEVAVTDMGAAGTVGGSSMLDDGEPG
ncbi:hypothetical protein ACFXG4_49025 [Nocardia sp. NPDC059246]|uniref:hypothetical protein n=1 Tax=unclassified Nocardia TaxID=2637762 RepID=UPI0036D081DD